jgi:hypothetical protein
MEGKVSKIPWLQKILGSLVVTTALSLKISKNKWRCRIETGSHFSLSLTLRVQGLNAFQKQMKKVQKPIEAKSIHALFIILYVLYLYILQLVFSTKCQRTAGNIILHIMTAKGYSPKRSSSIYDHQIWHLL